MFHVPEGQMGEAGEIFQKAMLFRRSGSVERKILSFSLKGFKFYRLSSSDKPATIFLYFVTQGTFARFISFTNFNAQFLYSLTICLLHYYPRHASSINMPIFRRTNCTLTASGIVALCKWQHRTPVKSGLESALNRCTVLPFTESDDTRCCESTIVPPEDGHVNARNMSRIVM